MSPIKKNKNTAKPKGNEQLRKPDHDIVWGSKNNNIREVKLALQENPDCINGVDENLMSALHWGGANRNYNICDLLFKQTSSPVNPWLEDSRKQLAIDHAIRSGASDRLLDLFNKHMFPTNEDGDPVFFKSQKSATVLSPDFRKDR